MNEAKVSIRCWNLSIWEFVPQTKWTLYNEIRLDGANKQSDGNSKEVFNHIYFLKVIKKFNLIKVKKSLFFMINFVLNRV